MNAFHRLAVVNDCTLRDTAIHHHAACRVACMLALSLGAGTAWPAAQYRVHPHYEDTVRVAVIWNDAHGICSDATAPVGEKTLAFVINAIDTTRVDHVKIIRNYASGAGHQATWDDIIAMWGKDSLPHVIVHVNAGWSHLWNGADLQRIFSEAVSRKIGVVSIGDDAANLANQTFGFDRVENVPAPLGDARYQGVNPSPGPIDSLWIGMIRSRDNSLKVYDPSTGHLAYPGVNGIISNAVDKILAGAPKMNFYKVGAGRCQADADRYAMLHPERLTLLGYQQGYWLGATRPSADELHVIVALQDTVDNTIRRGVALSYQPQFLKTTAASEQIVYDAIMFASLAHTLSVATALEIRVSDTAMAAGDTIDMHAALIDQLGREINDPQKLALITWDVVASTKRTGDKMVDGTGADASFTAIMAHRSVKIYAAFDADNIHLRDTATIRIVPGEADRLYIEQSANGMSSPNAPNHYTTMRLLSSDTEKKAWAIIRDRFGNYVENSSSTTWDTLVSGIVRAQATNQAAGEGTVTKLGRDGTVGVRAKSNVYSGNKFADTLDVVVDAATYTALRIRIYSNGNAGDIIDSLVMKTTDDTSLIVEGRRADGLGWETVPADWLLTAGLSAVPRPPAGQALWSNFSPADSGAGRITVRMGTVQTSIAAQFLPGWPEILALYPDSGNPVAKNLTPFPAAPGTLADTFMAGETIHIWAKLFDRFNVWLEGYEREPALSRLIQWKVSGGEEIASASDGAHVWLSSTRAYQAVDITASAILQGRELSQTMRVYIAAGPAHHLSIEASASIQKYTDDDPVGSITILENEDFRYVYAIMRDQWGNFAGYSHPTAWTSSDPAVFTADSGQLAIVGEGVATRAAAGEGKMIARDISTGFSDTIAVFVRDFSYTELKIINASGAPIDTLRMNTNQDTTLYVIGRRSNNPAQWDTVQVRWNISEGLKAVPGAPANASKWTFSPADTLSSGWITVTRGDESTTRPFTTYVVFTPGPPTAITWDILTPSDNRMAGRPMEAALRITNDDGPVPGTWCGQVVFDDLLDYLQITAAGDTLAPIVIIGGDTVLMGETARICFTGGIALVDVVLYYAPSNQTLLHTLTVTFTDTVTSTPLRDWTRTTLKPGPVNTINIVRRTLPTIEPFAGDSLAMRFNEGITIYLVGYDAYGNYIGPVKGDWTTAGEIPPIASPYNTQQIYYTAAGVMYESKGYIYAAYTGNSAIVDSLFVRIKPKPAQLVSATTRDLNGNGYLDALVLQFDKNIFIPDYFPLSAFTVAYQYSPSIRVEFFVDSIIPSGSAAATFILYVSENRTTVPNTPQTNWTPELSIANGSVIDIADTTLTSIDGAGPVIWSVNKVVSSAGDRTQDKVTVVFSESIKAADGSPLGFKTLPADLFCVWLWDEAHGEYVKIDDLLAGIENLTEVGDNMVVFFMSNAADLTGRHLLSINTQPAPVIGDGAQNGPNAENRRVNVQVKGAMGSIHSGPNPLYPVFSHFQNELEHVAPQLAYTWAKNEGGVVMTAEIALPDSINALNMRMTAALMIFDAIGNLVYTRKNEDDMVPASWHSDWTAGTGRQLVFYWNGITDKGVRAAPGIYRTVLLVKWGGEQRKFIGNVGVGR